MSMMEAVFLWMDTIINHQKNTLIKSKPIVAIFSSKNQTKMKICKYCLQRVNCLMFLHFSGVQY